MFVVHARILKVSIDCLSSIPGTFILQIPMEHECAKLRLMLYGRKIESNLSFKRCFISLKIKQNSYAHAIIGGCRLRSALARRMAARLQIAALKLLWILAAIA